MCSDERAYCFLKIPRAMTSLSLSSLFFRAATCVAGLLMVAALTLSVDAHAQYTGPGTAPADSTVQQVLQDPQDDQDVTLRGYLLEKLSSEKYMFSDDTGQIRVEIEDDEFPNLDIGPDTRIEISGEVETAFMRQPEIDVEQLRILDDASETVSSSTSDDA